MEDVKVKKIRDGFVMPTRADEGCAGYDVVFPKTLCANDIKSFTYEFGTPKSWIAIGDKCKVRSVTISPGERVLIPLGFAAEIPSGYEIQIRPRSGLALKKGISLANCVGTIDSSYRGEFCVALVNNGIKNATVYAGDRIAQLVVSRHESPSFVEVDELSDTSRGEGGFGSTGA